MMKVIRNSPRASAAILAGLLIAAALAVNALKSRSAPPPEPTKAPEPASTRTPSPTELPPTPTPTPTITPTITPTWTPTAGLVGPQYLQGHNPLTGLPLAYLTTLFPPP